jgi:hypothetical protein
VYEYQLFGGAYFTHHQAVGEGNIHVANQLKAKGHHNTENYNRDLLRSEKRLSYKKPNVTLLSQTFRTQWLLHVTSEVNIKTSAF